MRNETPLTTSAMNTDSGSTWIPRSTLTPDVCTYAYAFDTTVRAPGARSCSVANAPIALTNEPSTAPLASQPALRPGSQPQPSPTRIVPQRGKHRMSQPQPPGVIRAAP